MIGVMGCKTGEQIPVPPDTNTEFTLETIEASTPQTADKNDYHQSEDLTVPWDGVVEHIFFHPVVAYPELAFDGDSKETFIDNWMVTVDEYNDILDSIYARDYILVRIEDVWSEYTDENGKTFMKRNTLMLPEGKKPIVFSYDDINYYQYMLLNGFTHKLILGDDGNIWSYGLDPDGDEVISRDLDVITILDKFIEDHPDFSLNNAKGCIALTGNEGILGYRTQTDHRITSPTELAIFEENRQKEREAVAPIIKRLKETGWTFGSHTWGHIGLGTTSLKSIQYDTQRWYDEVGSLIGPTKILFYPFGERPDGNDVHKTGKILTYLQNTGFRVFASVGIDSFSRVKDDIVAVVCDRLHPDGTTLRWQRNRYLNFYDAWQIIDMESRPDRPYDRNP